MTDPSSTRPQKRRKPSAYPVAAGSLAAFMGLFGFMTHELRAGHDPALGNQGAVSAPLPKAVLVKRIEDHVVVTELLPPRESDDAAGPSGGSAIVAGTPVVSAPAPAPVQTVAAAPPPARAPVAPVVTRAS